MKAYVTIGATANDVLNIAMSLTAETQVEVEVEGPLDFSKKEGYYLTNDEAGNLILEFSEEKYNNHVQAVERQAKVAAAQAYLSFLQTNAILKNVDDEDAMILAPLYPEFKVGVLLTNGERVQYDNKLYKVIAKEPFVTTAEWTPDGATSLFVEINPGEWPEYKQPIGGNPYMEGDKITYNGKMYICKEDNTVWSPDETPERWEEQLTVETI